MRSATDFLPRLMSTLTNLATSPFEYFGSGRIARLGISLRRGMVVSNEVACAFRPSGRLGLLGAVLGAALLAVLPAGRIEASAPHVIAYAGQVLHAAAADEHHR